MANEEGGQEGMCGEKSGFLFSHACASWAVGKCTTCGKAICQEHTHQSDSGSLCTSCGKKEQRRARRAGRHYGYHDDPYFYGGSYYRGYGYYGHGHWGHSHYRSRHHHDGDDFTEADGASTHAEGDEDFEQDMGES